MSFASSDGSIWITALKDVCILAFGDRLPLFVSHSFVLCSSSDLRFASWWYSLSQTGQLPQKEGFRQHGEEERKQRLPCALLVLVVRFELFASRVSVSWLLETSFSSFRTVLASARPPNWGSPADDPFLVQLDSFPRKGFYRQQQERKETPLTMSFSSAASSICIIGLKNVCILAFGE